MPVFMEAATQSGTKFFHIGDGFHYHRNTVTETAVYFKCIHYETGCRGRAVYSFGHFRHTRPHRAGCVDIEYPQVMELRRNILNRCRNLDCTPFRTIIRQERRGYPMAVKIRVSLKRMRSAMQRVKRRQYPNLPETLEELTVILQEPDFAVITKTEDREDSVYAGSVDCGDGSHAILFASRRNLEVAKTVRVLFFDGTEKSLPVVPEAMQVLIIVGNWDHHILPFGMAVMSRKSEECYFGLLGLLRALLGGAPELQTVMTDFERALQNAVRRVFPHTQLLACFWHYVRALVYHLKNELQLGALMRRDAPRRIVRLCCALPLLPQRYIKRAYRLILREAHGNRRMYQSLRPFLSYICESWLNDVLRFQVMSVYLAEHRTNNSCESANRMLNRHFDHAHPSLYALIEAFVAMEEMTHVDATTLQAGENPSRRRRPSAIANDRRLRSLARQLRNPPGNLDDAIMRYLNAAVYTFEHVFDNAVQRL